MVFVGGFAPDEIPERVVEHPYAPPDDGEHGEDPDDVCESDERVLPGETTEGDCEITVDAGVDYEGNVELVLRGEPDGVVRLLKMLAGL